MEKYLLLYTYVDGISDAPFPSVENQVAVYDFSYDAKRMGGTPVISATFMYGRCLDKDWSYKVYALFNGQRFFLKQIPTSSFSNTDSRYKHEIELVSERIALDNVYLYDVVSQDASYDKPVSNGTKFTFFGNISEFAKRLNYSLAYSRIGYKVIVDEGITSDAKMVSFENAVFSNAIQEVYNTYNIPYYFVGNTIHIGYTNNDIAHIFRYGADESLLSVVKQNANQKIVTRITGKGSSDNIPYYYPNDYESKEEVEASGGKWINPQDNLMPPIYRQSSGEERFYNATNGAYEGYTFENEFVAGNPREHIIDFDDIKPTIVGITNASGQRIDMFSAFAYDTNDNDNFDEEGNSIHPYFFAKLRKTDGANGFNLFEHAIDEEEMTISMTSGSCAACEWAVMVDEATNKNTVQVDSNGNLVRDENGNIKFGTAQDAQNDTRNNEVWIALKKDIDTFGVIMPNVENRYKPSVNDTFVILHINLPKGYILAAEERLKDKLIEYMANNNSEKFNFSIAFSRIFFADNLSIMNTLDENARLQVEYDKEVYTLYVSSYSYTMSSDCPLPEIKVELSDTLTISRNALQEAMDSVKADMISMMDSVGKNTAYPNIFIRKDRDDYTSHLVSFLVGLKAFNYVQGMIGGSGAAIFKDEANKTVIEIDKIHAREELIVPKITFNCIDAISGDQAATFAYGTIKEVDTEKMVATLDLLEDQVGTLDVNDICRGVYHNLGGDNSTEEAVHDGNGFYKYAGFSTSYFTPVEILVNKPGEFKFRYGLQPNTSVHPMKGMNFFAYGNFIDQSRQSMTYQTRNYRRLLKKVNTWIIDPDKNIAGQWGDLTGLTIGGMQMSGVGTFQENSYFTGAYIQFTPQQKEEFQSYNVVLSSYEAVCHLDIDGNIISSVSESMNVVTLGSNVVTGNDNVVTTSYVFSTLIQAFRGDVALTYSGETYAKDGYMVSYSAKGCSASVVNGCAYITEITDTEECWVKFFVNCEGNALFEKQFNISFVKDAKSPITIDLDNEVDSVLCDDNGKVLLGLPLTTTVSMWYGAEKLIPDFIQLTKPSGMDASYNLGTGVITVTGITDMASSVLQLGITVSATYNNVKYERNVFFTVNKVKQGKDGENSVLYQLLPSFSVIKVDKAGNYSTNAISCSLKKTDGQSSVTTTTELPERYKVEVKTDGGSYSEYTLGSLIDVQSVKESVSFALKYSGDGIQYRYIDLENIPIIIDGTDGQDGESNIYADIDNEMDSVACDNSGHVVSTELPSTTVSMWYGITQLSLTGISISAPAGLTCNYSLSSGLITILSISDSADDVLPINVIVQAKYKEKTFTKQLVFTVNKIRPGADGKNAVIYNLNPSVTAIKKNSAGTYTPTSVSCTLTKHDGDTVSSISSIPSGYSMKYSADGGTVSSYSIGSSITITSYSTNITFYLYNNSTLVDRETIPVIIDGANGSDGQPGEPGKDGDKGDNAKYYIIESSVTVIGITSTGSYSPSSFIVSEYTINGASKTSSNVNYIHVYGMKDGSKSSRLTYSGSVNQWTFNAATYRNSDYDAFIFELVNSSSTSGTILSSCSVGVARKGNDGSAGPMGATLRPRGLYSSSSTYVYNSEFRDCVYDSSGNVWMVKTYGDSITGSTPSSSNSRWLQGNKAIFTAIDTALIDNANIAGFVYSNQKMMSSDKTSLILDGINGSITANKGTIGGFEIGSDTLGVKGSSSTYLKYGEIQIGLERPLGESYSYGRFYFSSLSGTCYIDGRNINATALSLRGITEGLRLSSRSVSNTSDSMQMSDNIESGFKIIKVIANNAKVLLPYPAKCTGAVFFIISSAKYTYNIYCAPDRIAINGIVTTAGSVSRLRTSTGGDVKATIQIPDGIATFLVCDGTYWYLYWCE